ncbi:unnamed protein product [Rhizophagus irregularis]|uniref:Uncharacterized protein n=1 Tax=Rhizophagus irregularis TaxID=588596 RepID=A0A2I1EDP8_9GLOM|nr:hypothetical protein RhiirB3_433472 [Rhizophagus irregularis]CAB5385883.1 unnamed protein product [Rhizophagus irregularis]
MENVIGAIDGSHIVLENVLLKQPETYWNKIFLSIARNCRLQRYDYRLCDWTAWLIHDAKVYKNSYFYQMFSKIIREEYLLGLLETQHILYLTFLIKPLIKNRFIALKELNVRDVSTIVKITECAIILHNCLELNNDNIEELYENDEDEDGDDDSNNDEKDINQNEIVMKREEERKSEQLMNPNY